METICHLQEHDDRVWHVCWSPSGNALASCGGDKVVRIWIPTSRDIDNAQWVLSATLEEMQAGTIRSCEFSSCGTYLATCSFDSTVAIWEHKAPGEDGGSGEWECITSLEGHDNEVKSVAWNQSGSMLATCSRDKTVWIWGTGGVESTDEDEEWECLSVLSGHTQDVKFVTWHPTEQMLFSASYDDTIKVWTDDLDDWLCVATLTGHKSTVWGLALNAAGNRLASCSQDCTIKVWGRDTNSGEWKEEQEIEGCHDKPIYTIDWSGDCIVSGGGDNAICTYKSVDKSSKFELALKTENAHANDINCVRFHPKKPTLLASASDEGDVKVWKLS